MARNPHPNHQQSGEYHSQVTRNSPNQFSVENCRSPPFEEAPTLTPNDEGITAVMHDAKEAANMNTRLFTLTPGHLMENPGPADQQQLPRGNDDCDNTLLHSRHGLTSDNGSMSSPSISSIVDPQYRAILPRSYSRASAASLLAHLPPRPVTDYLIAVYFNTVHWFMVVLHEGHFLYHYHTMMDLYARDRKLVPNTDEDYTFAVLLLMVVALGGRYTSIHAARTRRCKQIYMDFVHTSKHPSFESVDAQEHQHLEFDIVRTTSQIFYVVRSSTTDTLACGNLATVQSGLLLGSWYLYHGESNLAWANSGCTVRAAHALGLHKEHSELRWNSPYYHYMDIAEKCQLRRRLFWAVHTSDRFLAMCYGLPFLISDEDGVAGIPCEDNVYPNPGNASFLMVEDDLNEVCSARGISNSTGRPATLLTYQTYKLHIYIILGQIISSLYQQATSNNHSIILKYDSKPADPASCIQDSTQSRKAEELIKQVYNLEARLQNWYQDLPKALRLLADMTYPGCEGDFGGGDDDDGVVIPMEDDLSSDGIKTRKRRSQIKKRIYGIQALLLQLAYDNALILIHRPILSLKNNMKSMPSYEILNRSIEACWTAALRISNIGKHHIFHRSQQAHAISYVGIHLFTAGVVLSVFGSSDPLSRRALEAKQALSRIIKMQRRLRKKVVVSGQGLAILENMAREVVSKEMAAILAQETDMADEDDQGITGDRGQSRDSANHDENVSSTAVSWQSTNIDLQGQQDLHHTIRPDSTSICQPDLSAGLLMPYTNELFMENDVFNESVLDIEKCRFLFLFPLISSDLWTDRKFLVLSESQSLQALETEVHIDGTSMLNGGSQQAGLWWFSLD